ncbi:MAG: pirin family protein [Gammaproteobacteria bacterium]
MISVRHSHERGHADHGWLNSYHSFSFADYYDPEQMGFSVLRVINEDRVAAGAGFPTHGHSDMEIISYVLEGALEHKDSMGTQSVIKPGEVQRMSAGTGVRHSEYNHSSTAPVHFLQIWIEPSARGIAPGYEQKVFAAAERRNQLRLVAAPDGRQGALSLHQDACIYVAELQAAAPVRCDIAPGRKVYVQVARGALLVNGVPMNAGDGARITDERRLDLQGAPQAEILLFDLP